MKKYALSALCLAMSSMALAAEPSVKIDGVIPAVVTIHQTDGKGHLLQSAPEIKKEILLQHVTLSADAKKTLANRVDHPVRLFAANQMAVPLQADAGMNGVPVLDQGVHGTCVTFATTAALDAMLGHTDYISQLCNLSLGFYLSLHDLSYPSGWDGSTNEVVLSQIKQYGIITMDYQQQNGCALVHKYPLMNPFSKGLPMKADKFTAVSQKIMNNLSWKSWLDTSEAFKQQVKMDEVLSNVKLAVSNGHRVVIATLIDEKAGQNGADGSFHARYDSWVLTPQIAKDARSGSINAGHALVVTAYDDNAVITDSSNVQHKGVITLRNSWGAAVGDHGNYYMSYDYFLTLVMEVKELLPTA